MAATAAVVGAVAAVAGAGAAVYSASQSPSAPKLPKPPAALDKALTNPLPDLTALDKQKRARQAAALGRQGTLLTGPGGLGTSGSNGQPRSTLLGM
jgi:hypothetical protein